LFIQLSPKDVSFLRKRGIQPPVSLKRKMKNYRNPEEHRKTPHNTKYQNLEPLNK